MKPFLTYSSLLSPSEHLLHSLFLSFFFFLLLFFSNFFFLLFILLSLFALVERTGDGFGPIWAGLFGFSDQALVQRKQEKEKDSSSDGIDWVYKVWVGPKV